MYMGSLVSLMTLHGSWATSLPTTRASPVQSLEVRDCQCLNPLNALYPAFAHLSLHQREFLLLSLLGVGWVLPLLLNFQEINVLVVLFSIAMSLQLRLYVTLGYHDLRNISLLSSFSY